MTIRHSIRWSARRAGGILASAWASAAVCSCGGSLQPEPGTIETCAMVSVTVGYEDASRPMKTYPIAECMFIPNGCGSSPANESLENSVI